MVSKIRKHLTYANVMATLALVFAVAGGTAYATHLVVRSNDIVNDQVKSADVRNDNLRGGGLTSSDIATDAVGADEWGSVTVVSNNTSVPADGGVGEVTVTCGSGEQLIGGGARFPFPSGDLSKSTVGFFGHGPGWVAAGQNNGQVAQDLTVHALCLAPANN